MNAISNNYANANSLAGASLNNNHHASNSGSNVFENDKFKFSTHGTQDVSLHNKHTGDTHQTSGDFGQSSLDGCRHDHQGGGTGPIDQIVKKVIEAVCKKLGIDPKEIFGDQQQPQQPSQGGQPPSSGCRPEQPSWQGDSPFGQPPCGHQRPELLNSSWPAVQNDRPVSPFPNPLGLGSAQNQRDHNPIELALDPLGFF